MCVSGVKPWKLTNTYRDNSNDSIGDREGTKTEIETNEGVGTTADGNNELAENFGRAVIVVAAI